jgi:hypothetical protein
MRAASAGRPAAASEIRRADPRGYAAAGVAFVTVAGLAAAQGGYFPTSWGWSSVALLWAAACWAIFSRTTELSKTELLTLGLLLALVVWTGVSATWSVDQSASVLEAQRALVYFAGVLVILLLARRSHANALAGGLLAALTVVSTYALATRLFPSRLGSFDPVAVNRLADPIGYWNGLGILACLGILIALTFASGHRPAPVRVAAAASMVVFAPTLYFTYSRASWISLGVGIAVTVAVVPSRLRYVTVLLVLAPAPAAAVWLASRLPALTRAHAALPAAVAEGRRLALEVALLVVAAAVIGRLIAFADGRLVVPTRIRRGYSVLLVCLVVAAAAFAVVRAGTPASIAHRAYRSFAAPPPRPSDLNKRLFNFSGNGRTALWHVAWQEYRHHPVLGSGAGSYEIYWLRSPRATFTVRDAHGLYIETLSELGPFGLALLVSVLAVPIAAAVAVRRFSTLTGLVGAYAAFLVHAAVDWDWELPAVTMAGLLIGATLLIERRRTHSPIRLRPWARGALLAVLVPLFIFAGAGLLGNSAAAASAHDLELGRWRSAADEAIRARRFMPWSSRPWVLLGEAQLGTGDLGAARVSLEHARARGSEDWRTWFDLALASHGRDRRLAIARTRALYPRNPDLAMFSRH